jgi:hypothetical protein
MELETDGSRRFPANVGNVEGIADGKSTVYVTGVSDEPQTLMFIA